MKGYSNPQLLITPSELVALVHGDAATRPLILDLRPPDAYAAGHIPGSIHLDLWGVSLTDTDPAPLKAFLWMIEHVLAVHGVTESTPVVVYDDQSGIRAARAFWFFEYFGHSSVRLLDGGFGAWSRERLPVTRDAAPTPTTEWTGRRDDRTLATWRDVRDGLSRSDVVLLDARTDGEYCGTTVRAKRGGAIPGAVHVEWTRNLTPEGDFKPAADLKKMYEDAGVTPDREVITYCQGGYRAAHSYLALRLLGYPRVRNYLGSWKEWGDREDLPIQSRPPEIR
jgi:thiosulfate/3-mercaptopyruvate sulfurtransferase